MSEPRLSVVMCVYNGAKTVGDAIQSILSQSFADFEFIILDDGSTDATPDVLAKAMADERVRVLRQENAGLTRSLNRAIGHARARLIARQDADDLSLPDRLARQVAFLDAHPNVNLLGTGHFEQWGGRLYIKSPPTGEELPRTLFLHNPFAHSSVMFRTDVFWSVGGYDETFRTGQDFELWMRFGKYGPVAAISDQLIVRKVSQASISSRKRLLQCYNGLRARLKHPEHGVLHAARTSAYQFVTSLLPHSLVDFKRRLQGRSDSTRPSQPF
jgi:glycosyltransferase involved in cell wall biosynthesis